MNLGNSLFHARKKSELPQEEVAYTPTYKVVSFRIECFFYTSKCLKV